MAVSLPEKMDDEKYQALIEALQAISPSVSVGNITGRINLPLEDARPSTSIGYSNKSLNSGTTINPDRSPDYYINYEKDKGLIGGGTGSNGAYVNGAYSPDKKTTIDAMLGKDGLDAGVSYKMHPEVLAFLRFMLNGGNKGINIGVSGKF